jgi:hypothetical protein
LTWTTCGTSSVEPAAALRQRSSGTSSPISDAADALTESELEARFRKLIEEAGLPQPEAQVWLDLHDGEPKIRADFLYRGLRLILETDGARYHDPESDKRRDQRAAAAGYTTIRFTRRQVICEPARVRRTLARAYASALSRSGALAA